MNSAEATVKAGMLRELAEECRALADTLHHDLRDEMLRIAESYDNMADVMVRLAEQKARLASPGKQPAHLGQ